MVEVNWIAIFNFISRWLLFTSAAYKAYQTRNKGWALITTAFFIDALDIESYILTPLGITVPKCSYLIASKIPNFYFSIFAFWGSFHLRYLRTSFKQLVYLIAVAVVSYVWLFLLAIDAFHGDFALSSSVPSLLLAGALIYLAYVMWSYVIGRRWVDRLFPIGLVLVGFLNLTYPVTRPIPWFAEIAFLLAALGRFMAAVGLSTFVFYPLAEPHRLPETFKPGAYLFKSEAEVQKRMPDLFKRDIVAITRLSPELARERFTPNSVVFWITRAKEGEISENPRIMAMPPSKIGILQDIVAKELEKGYRTVYLDAMEYLSTEVGFTTAVKFLLSLKDLTVSRGGSLVGVINLSAFKDNEARIIRKEFGGD
ncbi:DUF835 domain-containing protein [Thermococcus sp.]|uniref:DUF835 domain-containing protein n=1 Tax=Thermococcus sp. TaxID=35749 RepID=UPI0026381F7D|nr:DUF835 domain-containing protein [Thermococcus sp.]